MRLAFRLAVWLLVGVIAVQLAYGYARFRREVALFESDIRQDHLLLGTTLAVVTARVLATRGPAAAGDVVEDTNVHNVDVRIRWIGPEEEPAVLDSLPEEARATIEEDRTWSEVRDVAGEGRRLFTWVPVPAAERTGGMIELSESLAAEQAYVRTSVERATTAALLTIALTGSLIVVLGFLLVGRPVRRLVRQARKIGDGDLSGRLEFRRRDEIGALARELDQMADRLTEAQSRIDRETRTKIAAMDQLRHADRLTTVGKLASGVAHELGTPLNVVLGRSQMIASGEVSGAAARDNARVVVEQSERMVRIIRGLLDFARRRGPMRKSEEIAPLVEQSLALLAPIARKQGVETAFRPPETPLRARMDVSQILQVLTNVLMNGIQSMPGGGRLEVRLDRRRLRPPTAPDGGEAEFASIAVEDAGTGIAEEDLPHVFDPFFTTKQVGEGTGLGLSVAWGIVQDHEGWIDVRTEPGRGSCFTIRLPAEEES
jgi:signal transduction histidine kinase